MSSTFLTARFTRRALLKALAVSGGVLRLGECGARVSAAFGRRAIAVPPSVMLHARQDHLDNLPALIDWLLAGGFAPINYRALWDALTGDTVLPPQPVILSIDDLTLIRGSNNFHFIERMVERCIEKAVPVVLGINTRPLAAGAGGQVVQLTDQDDALWDRAEGWLDHGVELATHTHSHRNLADPGMTPDDYRYEIGGSARMIEERTGQRVSALVLPYGNGTVENQHDGPLLPPIVEACRDARIGMVAGVAGGRAPLMPAPPEAQPVYFVGRVGPLRDRFGSIYGDVEHWRGQNDALDGRVELP